MNKKEKMICCICGNEFEGFGNNPEPVKSEGRCCDKCNQEVVIPARLDEWMKNYWYYSHYVRK